MFVQFVKRFLAKNYFFFFCSFVVSAGHDRWMPTAPISLLGEWGKRGRGEAFVVLAFFG